VSPIDYVLPVGGVILILAVIYLTGGYRTARVGDMEAKTLFAEQVPGFKPSELLLSGNGLAALARDGRTGALAVAYAMGDRINARALAPGDVVAYRVDGGRSLTLRLNDFTHGTVTIALGKESGNLNEWTRALDGLTERNRA
jgi:hypothetical protein